MARLLDFSGLYAVHICCNISSTHISRCLWHNFRFFSGLDPGLDLDPITKNL